MDRSGRKKAVHIAWFRQLERPGKAGMLSGKTKGNHMKTKMTVLLLMIALVAAGCRPPSAGPAGTMRSDESYPASAFSIPLLDGSGGSLDLNQYKGKVVLLDFWATWCAPCRHELPGLARLHESLQDKGFVVVGMTVDQGAAEDVARAVSRFNLPYPVGLAGPETQALYGGIRAVPTKFLLDREGNIRQHYEGVVSEEALRSDVESLLNS